MHKPRRYCRSRVGAEVLVETLFNIAESVGCTAYVSRSDIRNYGRSLEGAGGWKNEEKRERSEQGKIRDRKDWMDVLWYKTALHLLLYPGQHARSDVHKCPSGLTIGLLRMRNRNRKAKCRYIATARQGRTQRHSRG
jgi:hypothetical protein